MAARSGSIVKRASCWTSNVAGTLGSAMGRTLFAADPESQCESTLLMRYRLVERSLSPDFRAREMRYCGAYFPAWAAAPGGYG